MNTAYIPILLIVAGGLIYQLSQKAIRHDVNVYFAICAAYLVGIVICLVTQYFSPADEPFWQSAKKMNWAIIGVGLGAALVEVGFLIAYRAGWKISATSMLVNMLMSVALVPIGVFFFRDKISKWNALGIAFYFAGLILISRK